VKGLPRKTARFSQVVAECGHPESVTLWSKPENDKSFTIAIQQNRVLTLVQHNVGTAKDFGLVGFHKRKYQHSSFLTFPRRLDDFEDKRIVGIDYELIGRR